MTVTIGFAEPGKARQLANRRNQIPVGGHKMTEREGLLRHLRFAQAPFVEQVLIPR